MFLYERFTETSLAKRKWNLVTKVNRQIKERPLNYVSLPAKIISAFMVLIGTLAYIRCALLFPQTIVSTTVPNTASYDLSTEKKVKRIKN